MAVTLHAHTMSAVLSGNRGAVGVGIADITFNDDYTMTITLTDGSTYTSGNLRGAQGIPGIDAEYDDEELVITTGDHTETDGGEVSTIRVKGEARTIRDRVTEEMAYSAYPTETVTGDIVSIADGAENIPVKALSVAVEPVQAGSGDPSPDNVRAITGWDAVNVVRCGVNVWDGKTEKGMIAANGNNTGNDNASRTVGYIPVVEGATYYCKSAVSNVVNARFYDADKNHMSNTSIVNTTFTVPTGARYLRFYLNEYPYTDSVSVNYPSTDHDLHEPSSIDTYPIPLPSTVYGGTLDVASGVMTVDRAMVTVDATNWRWNTGNYGAGYRYYTSETVSDALNGQTCETNIFPKGTSTSTKGVSIMTANKAQQVDVKIDASLSQFNTVDAWKAYITQTPLQILYKLATPYTITLDPTTVSTLLGNSTLYADAGQVSVAYRADVGLYIDGKITAVMAAIAELS